MHWGRKVMGIVSEKELQILLNEKEGEKSGLSCCGAADANRETHVPFSGLSLALVLLENTLTEKS